VSYLEGHSIIKAKLKEGKYREGFEEKEKLEELLYIYIRALVLGL
jgi:hypothetical protein